VALAALVFAAVAWFRLGDAGRAGLLGGATLVAALATLAARRRRPATGEARGGLTLGLVLSEDYRPRATHQAAGRTSPHPPGPMPRRSFAPPRRR